MGKSSKILLIANAVVIAFFLGVWVAGKINPPRDFWEIRYLVLGVDELINSSNDAEMIAFHCSERAKLYKRYADITWGQNPKCPK